MGTPLKNGISLSGSEVWLNAPCPIVFFAFNKFFAEADSPVYKIRQILTEQTTVLEIGNIYVGSEGLQKFNIFVDRYALEVEFSTRNRNFGITGIFYAGERTKRSFIENKVKLINVSEHGIIFARLIDVENFNVEITPESRSKEMREKFYSGSEVKMPFSSYYQIRDYIIADSDNSNGEFVFDYPYFDEKYLNTIEQYAAVDQMEEDEKAAKTTPVTYYSRKSVKRAGDKRNKYKYEFVCGEYDVSIYTPGSEVNVGLADEIHFERGRIVEIGDVEDGKQTMTLSFNDQFNDSDIPMSGLLYKAAGSCQKKVRDRVVEGFRTGTTKALYMLNAFNNPDKIETMPFDESIDTEPIIDEIKENRAPYLNPMQQKAIEAGIKSTDLALVLGPPGTGKTTVIVEWALYFMRQRKRVLISSKNNKAVDNAFERIAKYIDKYPEFKDLVIARVGNAEKVQSNVVEFMLDNQHLKMQEKILKNNGAWLGEIDRTLEIIKTVSEDIKSEEERINRLFETIDAMKGYYDKITALLRKLTELEGKIALEHQKVQVQLDALESICEKIESKNIYLEENKRLGFFGKVFRIVETCCILHKRYKLSQEVKNFRLTDNSPAVVGQYNRIVSQIENIISEEGFVSLKKEYEALFEYLEAKGTYEIKDPSSDNVLTFNYSVDKEAFIGFCEAMADLAKKCIKIKNILGDWEKNVSDKDNEVLTNLLTRHLSVVGATCIGINTNRSVAELDFDVAIIDEAGQIQIHDLFVPMSRAPKTLMLGDHKQIPPSVNDTFLEKCESANVDTELAKKSFFEYLFEQKDFPKDNKVLLDTQFRMPQEVADIISKWFYNNKYHTFDDKKTGIMPLRFPDVFESPLVIIDTCDAPVSERRETTEYDRKSNKKSRYNNYEAKIIASVLEKIGFMSPDSELGINDIGVVTALKRQKEEIKSVLRKAFPGLSTKQADSMVATVDSFQGQEREIIIYSCTRSNDRNEIGFLSELRRLNVALSRCQSQIVLVGDFDFLTTCTDCVDDDDDEQSVMESVSDAIADEETSFADEITDEQALPEESDIDFDDFALEPDSDSYDESSDDDDYDEDYSMSVDDDVYAEFDEALEEEYGEEGDEPLPDEEITADNDESQTVPIFGFADEENEADEPEFVNDDTHKENSEAQAPVFGFADDESKEAAEDDALEESEAIGDDVSDETEEYESPELDSTVRSFSRFMSFLLEQVQSGSGQYIKSKEFGDKDE